MAENIMKLFNKKETMTLVELSKKMNCSNITVRRRLIDLNYLTSYNLNSRFYTLERFATFNEYGIWTCGNAKFTKHKTLEALIINCLIESASGYSAKELESIISTSVTPTLLSLFKRGAVNRIKECREYYYFSSKNQTKAKKQIKIRFGHDNILDNDAEAPTKVKMLNETIFILLEMIRTRPQSTKALVKSISISHPNIPFEMVVNTCKKYKIELKKKTNRLHMFEIAVKIAAIVEKITLKPYIFNFRPDKQRCTECNNTLTYYKSTSVRSIFTLRFGKFTFNETQNVCNLHSIDNTKDNRAIYSPSFPKLLVAPRLSVGYDVIAYIGQMRFLQFRQVTEVKDSLKEKGIPASLSAISRYSDWFLAAIECLHSSKFTKLRKLIKENGGYFLHVDATTENKSSTVFVCLDRITGIVLLSEKIPTENEDDITAQLRNLKKKLGSPVTVMRDMGKPIGNSSAKVFKNSSDRVCHFHFLKDVGKDLLGNLNIEIGKRFTKLKINAHLNRLKRTLEKSLALSELEDKRNKIEDHKNMSNNKFIRMEAWITYSLVSWIFEYSKDGNGLGFPFERLRLSYYKRVNSVQLKLSRIMDQRKGALKKCTTLMELQKIVCRSDDFELRESVRKIKKICAVFDKLRTVLRFYVSKKAPLTKTMGIEGFEEIKRYNKELKIYSKELIKKSKQNTISHGESIILEHIIRYQDKLPIPEDLIELFDNEYFERTNNDEESLFRDCKRGQRRASGNKDVSREFNMNGPYLPLMLNLKNDSYLKKVIGPIDELPERLSELAIEDIEYYSNKLKENRNGKLHGVMLKLINFNVI